MKKHLMTLAVGTILFGMAGAAFAGHDRDHDHAHHHGHGHHRGHADSHRVHGNHQPAYAKVLAVQPIVRVVTVSAPRETCWTEEVVHQRPNRTSAMPTVLGGVVGGVIGHEIGKGRNRGVATVAGAVIGAAIGDDIGRREAGHRAVVTTQEQCRTTREHHNEERIDGYWVTYRFQGETFRERMDSHPGDRIRVQVAAR